MLTIPNLPTAIRLSLCALFLGSLVCGACAQIKGVHLYNAADDKTAAEASKSFKDANIPQSVAEERQREAIFLSRELAASDRLTDASRDAVLLAVLGGPQKEKSCDYLNEKINSRIADLVGSAQEQPDLKQPLDSVEVSEELYNGLRSKSDPLYQIHL